MQLIYLLYFQLKRYIFEKTQQSQKDELIDNLPCTKHKNIVQIVFMWIRYFLLFLTILTISIVKSIKMLANECWNFLHHGSLWAEAVVFRHYYLTVLTLLFLVHASKPKKFFFLLRTLSNIYFDRLGCQYVLVTLYRQLFRRKLFQESDKK